MPAARLPAATAPLGHQPHALVAAPSHGAAPAAPGSGAEAPEPRPRGSESSQQGQGGTLPEGGSVLFFFFSPPNILFLNECH